MSPSGSKHAKLATRLVAMLAPLLATGGLAVEPLTHYGFDESWYSPAAREGMTEIFSGRCFHAGIPIRVMSALGVAKSDSASATGSTPGGSREKARSAETMPSPPSRPFAIVPGLPLGVSVYRRNGVVLANGNCFDCHAGVVNGHVVAGLGNNRTDQAMEFDGFKSVFADRDALLATLKTDPERKELTEFLDHASASVSVLQYARTRGDNFGPYAVWRLGARLADPENTGMIVSDEKTELDELLESIELPTVDPMPWWLMKYKKKDYWYSDGGPEDASHFSFNFTTAHPEVNDSRASHVASVAKALAFARETQSPPFPKPLDAERVQKGADIFHGRTRPVDSQGFVACKTCHGSYTRKDSQFDFATPGSWTVSYDSSTVLRNVKTDGAYNATVQKLKPIAEHIRKLAVYFERRGTPELAPDVSVPSKEGYVAPPLVGVWATAPYFHNGSVPTIELVLNSKERPEIWWRNTDPHAYNFDQVGLDFRAVSREELARVQEEASEAGQRSHAAAELRSLYDTRGYGRGRMGHTFGDRLTAEERLAVIEFLKSLSGPDM